MLTGITVLLLPISYCISSSSRPRFLSIVDQDLGQCERSLKHVTSSFIRWDLVHSYIENGPSWCNLFDDRVPVDEIYRYHIFKWVALTWQGWEGTRIVVLVMATGLFFLISFIRHIQTRGTFSYIQHISTYIQTISYTHISINIYTYDSQPVTHSFIFVLSNMVHIHNFLDQHPICVWYIGLF